MPMLPSEIGEDEILFRGVTTKPDMWKAGANRPTSAIFKDSGGASVDRDGGRNDNDAANSLCDWLAAKDIQLRAVVKISAGVCRRIETELLARPLEDNPYHAEIHVSGTRKEISDKAKELRKNCQLVCDYSP